MVGRLVQWRGRVELMLDGQIVLDEEGIRILAAIRDKGSIADAAESVGRSYAYVWRHIQKASKGLGYQLVDTIIGGSDYGGAVLTMKAKALLDDYNRLLRLQGDTLSGRGKKSAKPIDLTVTGSDCPGVRVLLEHLHDEARITSDLRAVGSAAGLAALMLREADIVGLHLLDEGTGQYNIPFLKRFWIDDRTTLVRGYLREQGLIVRRGNPRRVASIDDLTRKEVRLVNRQRGSGTRILLDHLLSRLAERRSVSVSRLVADVRGYENEVRSHGDVMAQISARKADVGLGLKPTEDRLDFISLHEEFFDFAMDRDKMKRAEVQAFTKLLSSRRFAEGVKGLGIKTTRESGNVVYP